MDKYGAEYGFEVKRFEFRTGREDFSGLLPEAMDWGRTSSSEWAG
ncbi:MAG: hypothetical protein R3B51_09290 [Thermodesulfobacteriota bacterium]